MIKFYLFANSAEIIFFRLKNQKNRFQNTVTLLYFKTSTFFVLLLEEYNFLKLNVVLFFFNNLTFSDFFMYFILLTWQILLLI